MSLSAIVVMIASIIALWGVASWALVYSMRQEERKLRLIKEQGDFEPYSPRAFRDLERWIERHDTSEHAQEMQGVREEQREALHRCRRHFYDWRDDPATT
ncbi:hypothetical protein ACPF7Z_02905 [Halomonas sp. GXIMD04776]|uniref:hypothetical protein n=1 Tax=Halomonas sp. GXIMD04776 TaxID=3415605 RepID=UPI003CA4F3EE